jgi:hypothetical protein
MSETFAILKHYRVFQGRSAGEPMDIMDEDKLVAWLRARGYSEMEAEKAVEKADEDGSVELAVPREPLYGEV